jgi:F-box/leucine-rich repeat protein 13
MKRAKRVEVAHQMKLAEQHHVIRQCRQVFHTWQQWIEFRCGRQAMAANNIQHVYEVAIVRMVFSAWHSVTQTARKTREYFERLERGEELDVEDDMGESIGEPRDDISMLPNKAAVKIFSYISVCDLARCAQVCRSWKMLTENTLLLSQLDLTSIGQSIKDHVSSRLLVKYRPYLVHANLRSCQLVGNATFRALSECRNLQDLNLSAVKQLSDDGVKGITEGCRILLYLNVSDTNITDASLRYIATNLNNLQFLSTRNCQKFTDKGIGYLASGKAAKRLIYFDMSACNQVTKLGYQYIAEGMNVLQHLILNDLDSLNDCCFEQVAEKCVKLQTLSVLGSQMMSDESFIKLASNGNLKQLKIDSNHVITDQSLKVIGHHCSDLYYLHLVDCPNITDSSLKALMFCNIVVLNLADCIRVSDAGVKYIMEGTCGLRLQELNLTNCLRVGDVAIVNIQKRGRNLAYLSLCYCDQISEAGLELLGQVANLTCVDITGCSLTDQSLSALGNNTHLRDVNMSQCSSITDLGLQKFAQQCVWIDRLNISCCTLITDAAIKNVVFSCRLLMHLNVAGCKLLTDLSVQYISAVCHYVLFLDISACPCMTDKSLRYLKEGCRRLQTLVMLHSKGITRNGANKISKFVAHVHYSDDQQLLPA